MNIFVASWFFPPSLSSEGIVTYKLFRNSRHHYDVCASSSRQWSYNKAIDLIADNIEVFSILTDEFSEWIEYAVGLFEERHKNQPYDAIMTRSMPPESIEVGRIIKERYPDIPWIASIADPIAKSPYDINGYVIGDNDLSDEEKKSFQSALVAGCQGWKNHRSEYIVMMCDFKDVEDFAIKNADALIFPHDTLRHYVLGSRRRKYAVTVPHSFDRELYPAANDLCNDDGRVVLSFLGHSDAVRSLEPVVRAVNQVRLIDESALERIRVRFVGHVTEDVRALIYNYDLFDCISVESDVDYETSLGIMRQSDWLIHIDAYFDFLDYPGKSVYFAGKIADYLGTNTPVLAITGNHSPAYEIVSRAGGVCVEPANIAGIAEALVSIADGVLSPMIDRGYRDRFDAVNVAQAYDSWLEDMLQPAPGFSRSEWPVVPHYGECSQKFLTVCVPVYNTECYLDRCLLSLASSPCADQLEVIIVNDGSTDSSREIALAYQERYPAIFSLVDKENGGHGSTINTALDRATGIYFRVLDSDDWVDGENLAKLIDKMRTEGLWADLVSANYHQVFAESGSTIEIEKKAPIKDYVLHDFANADFSKEYFSIHSMMIATELLRAADFRITEHAYYVDVEYMLCAIPYVHTVMFAPEHIYRYAVGNSEQSINPDVFVSRYDHHDRVIRRMVDYYSRYEAVMSPGQIRYMKTIIVKYLLNTHYTLSLIWDPDKERGYARARDFDEYLRNAAPGLYAEFGRTHLPVLVLRAAKFNPDTPTRPAMLDSIEEAKEAVHKVARLANRVPVYRRFARSDFAESLRQRIR